MNEKNAYLIKNTLIIFFSKFCTQFLSFLILPVITSKLSTIEYGDFDLINTYGWLIVPYMSLQLENGIFRFLIDKRNTIDEQQKIITNGIISLIIQCIIFSILYFCINCFFDIQNYLYIYLYAISTLFLNIPLFIARGMGDNHNYAIASIITGVSNVLISLISVYFFDMRINGLVLSVVISNVFGALYLIIKNRLYDKIRISKVNKHSSKELIKYSAPLVPNMTSAWIMNVSDKMMISLYLNTGLNGIYSISTKFPVLLSHVFSVFNMSWTETASLSSNDVNRDIYFSNTVDNIFKICSSICLITLSSMPVIFSILINRKFEESYFLIPILICASIFEMFSGILGGIYISLKLSKKIAISTFLAGIINLLINLLFMKQYGVIIACISTLISYLCLSIYRFFDIKKHVKLKLNYKIYILTFLVLVLVVCQYYIRHTMICLIVTIAICFYSFVMNKNILIELKNKIVKKG